MKNLELVIRYIGYGQRCDHCCKIRSTTRYQLRQGEDILQEYKLCDECQDGGFAIKFRPISNRSPVRKELKRRIKLSQKLEKDLARDVDGSVTPGSGNKDTKSDVRVLGEWRLEHKFTDNVRSYTLKVEDLAAVIRHGNLSGEWPAMVINFRAHQRKFVVMPYEAFIELKEELRDRDT